MDDTEVIKILVNLLKKYSLDEREIEAVKEAIGILSWSKLSEGYMNRKKRVRDQKHDENDRGNVFE